MIQLDRETIVCLCDRSGIAARPWVEAGYRAVCVDVALERGVTVDRGVTWIGGDVRTLTTLRGSPLGVFAFPPCTHLANVGASAWARKGEAAFIEALSIADACLRLCVTLRPCWWAIENPVGRLTHSWGPPDHVFDPCDYGGYLLPPGDAYTKRTCLWVGGAWTMPTPRPVKPVEGSLVGVVENVDRRSETPRGFARAVFETLQLANPLRAGEALPTRLSLPAGDPLHPWESLRPGDPIQVPGVRVCRYCGRTFQRGRVDQVFCSARCRVAACRARQRAG